MSDETIYSLNQIIKIRQDHIPKPVRILAIDRIYELDGQLRVSLYLEDLTTGEHYPYGIDLA